MLGSWQPVAHAGELEQAIAQHPANNGTDLVGALRLARAVAAEGGAPTAIVVITDGMLPELGERALADAVRDAGVPIDVHVVALEPGREHPSSAAELRQPIDAVGGSRSS